MNKTCKCGGTLKRTNRSQVVIVWECPKCHKVVTQRKRRPDKLNAVKDIVKIREHVKTLVERNPVTEKNREEWKEFVRAYIKVYSELRPIIEKVTITL